MKPSDRITMTSLGAGTAAGLALAYWLPFLPWWLDAIIGLMVAGSCYQTWLRIYSEIAIIDSPTINPRLADQGGGATGYWGKDVKIEAMGQNKGRWTDLG